MPSDAFACIADALRLTMSERSATGMPLDEIVWDAPARNRLLDACGSDHRPLVDLVLSVGASVVPPLRALVGTRGTRSTRSAGEWERERAPLVHAVVSTRFLQADVARWAVDAWAIALGVAPRTVLHAPVISSAGEAPTERIAPRRSVANAIPLPSGSTGQSIQRAARAAAASPRPTLPLNPSSTRQRIGSKWPTAPRVSLPPDPRLAQRVRRIEKAAVIALALLVSGVMALLTHALSRPRAEPGTPAPVASVAPVASIASIVPVPAATAQSAPLRALEPPTRTRARASVARGVAGVYQVAQHVRSVDGSPSCAQVADALVRKLSTVERIDHLPGASHLSLASRLADGSIDADGFFTLGPREGTTKGVRWRFVMHGQFHATGFVGESRTETFAVIRWGRTQSCIAVADLVGQRVD